MVIRTKKSWSEEIREISESPEFQRARIKIVDRSLMVEGEYNADTDEYDGAGTEEDATIYVGQARLVSSGWGVGKQETNQSNPQNILNYRVQVPLEELPQMVKKGSIVTVISAPNQAIVGRPMSVITDFHGSTPGARTIQCKVSGDFIGD